MGVHDIGLILGPFPIEIPDGTAHALQRSVTQRVAGDRMSTLFKRPGQVGHVGAYAAWVHVAGSPAWVRRVDQRDLHGTSRRAVSNSLRDIDDRPAMPR